MNMINAHCLACAYVTAATLSAIVNESAEQAENGGRRSDGQLCSAQQRQRRKVNARRGAEQESADA